MIKKIIFVVIVTGVTGLLILYSPKGDSGLPEVKGKTWLSINPIQCQGNPWEQYERPPNKGVTNLTEMQEIELVKTYYGEYGITIFDIKFQKPAPETAVCLACDCPRGDTLQVLVAEGDITKMLSFGYTKVEE